MDTNSFGLYIILLLWLLKMNIRKAMVNVNKCTNFE